MQQVKFCLGDIDDTRGNLHIGIDTSAVQEDIVSLAQVFKYLIRWCTDVLHHQDISQTCTHQTGQCFTSNSIQRQQVICGT